MKQHIIIIFIVSFAFTSNAQVNNSIFSGGIGDGWASLSYQQTENLIFAGGNGDGWAYGNYQQPESNIFTGNVGDGWASEYMPPFQFLSLADLEKAGIRIYPNPIVNFLNISFDDNDSFSFALYDCTGKHILSKIVSGDDQIDMGGVSAGVYYVHLQKMHSDTVHAVKLIKK